MNRAVWFVAGAATGVYTMVKARRAAEAVTPDGVRDRLAALSLGARLLGDEVRTEMATKENELRQRTGLVLDGWEADRPLETGRPLELTRKGND